jgi:hypothetical protein
MPGIEYIVVFIMAFSSGYEVGKHKNCGHQHIIIQKKPWYTLNARFHFHNKKCKPKCKHKKHNRRKWRKHFRKYDFYPGRNGVN